jgi:molecular chaperone GrpE (heat shock protein)
LSDIFSRFRRPQDQPPESQPNIPANGPAQDDTLNTTPFSRIENQLAALIEGVSSLEKQMIRSAKEQLKANALSENAVAQTQEALSLTKAALGKAAPEARPSLNRPPTALASTPMPGNMRMIEALMPILDGIEAALSSGHGQIQRIQDEQAREILRGWLEGQRLLRERLLALFEKESVRPIATVGQPFDPYRHVAVERVFDTNHPAGTIIEERRRGYETDQRVLRFAEVVVATTQP